MTRAVGVHGRAGTRHASTGYMARWARWTTAALGIGVAGYAARMASAWWRYGDPAPPTPPQRDALLDRVMPTYDVVERHAIRITAPASVALETAKTMSLQGPLLVRAIFRAREIVLGARHEDASASPGLLEALVGMGWRVLAEEPGREVVVGGATQPWLPNVTFRGIPPADFASFREPDFVKIAWTLRADPIDSRTSIFRTETRAIATDAAARRKFRWYWARFSPGIVLIRRLLLWRLKPEAERRAAAERPYFGNRPRATSRSSSAR